MELWKNQGKGAGRLLRGLAAALLITVALLLAFAFALFQFAWDDEKTKAGILVIYVLSCAAGGWCCARTAQRRCFLWGLLTGALYYLLLFAASALTGGIQTLTLTGSLIAFLLCAAGGMLGGMFS